MRERQRRLALRRGRPWEPAAAMAGAVVVALIAAVFLVPRSNSFDGVPTDPAQVEIEPTIKPPSPEILRRARGTPTAVLSAVGVPRIAAQTGARLRRQGFLVSAVADAPRPRRRSHVLYSPGHDRVAKALARSLGIPGTAPLDAATRSVAPAAPLAVVLGGDRR